MRTYNGLREVPIVAQQAKTQGLCVSESFSLSLSFFFFFFGLFLFRAAPPAYGGS